MTDWPTRWEIITEDGNVAICASLMRALSALYFGNGGARLVALRGDGPEEIPPETVRAWIWGRARWRPKPSAWPRSPSS